MISAFSISGFRGVRQTSPVLDKCLINNRNFDPRKRGLRMIQWKMIHTRPPGLTPRTRVKRKLALFIGYDGQKFSGLQRNEGVWTVSDVLEKALHECELISSDNFGHLSKVKWSVAARTDKGVSSAGNVVGIKLAIKRDEDDVDYDEIVREANKVLDDSVRVFGAMKVTNSFSARLQCASRSYEYLIPLDVVQKGGSVEKFSEILTQMEGTHWFHNFTAGVRIPPPKSAVRYVMRCSCDPDTISIGSTEWVRIVVHGQSFLLHMIRKMVALALMIHLEMVPADSLTTAFDRKQPCNIPPAPATGLMMDQCHFDYYNKSMEALLERPVSLSPYADMREAFKREKIYPSIAFRTLEGECMDLFFETANKFCDLIPRS